MNRNQPDPPADIWNSDRAKQTVREVLAPEVTTLLGERFEWHPPPSEEVWQVLSREAREFQHRPAGVRTQSMDFDEELSKRERLDRAKLRLLAFAKILRRWRLETAEKHGRDFWDRIMPSLDDPKERMAVELIRQVSARTLGDAVDDLVALGRTGLRYRLVTGQKRVHRVSDCGIELLVEATRRVDARLQQLLPGEHLKHQRGTLERPSLGDSTSWQKVLLYFEPKVIRLSYKRAPPGSVKKETLWCSFKGPKQIAFILALFSVYKGRMSLPDLFEGHTHKGESFHDERRRVIPNSLEKLTQLRRSVESALKAQFGDHPSGVWILESDGVGYGLNPEGTHWRRCHGKDRD